MIFDNITSLDEKSTLSLTSHNGARVLQIYHAGEDLFISRALAAL